MKQNLNVNRITKPELLAPAGNITTFYSVIKAGADAVYMAGNRFGARAYADNFSDDEIIRCISYAHLLNKKIYLTVNTLTRENELPQVIEFLKPFYEAGLDGVIIQDIGVLEAIRKAFPKLLLHASTQMTITGYRGANYLKTKGVSRIVPAREISLNEIKDIKAKTGLELECFIHGAMCYCYSGQCLFSSVVGKRSGNRGRCAQPCRLPYKLDDSLMKGIKKSEEIFPFSLKDMCTLDILGELIEAGIDSFKIEGRMKKPEYAAGTVSIYRKYIDQYFDIGQINVSREDRYILENLYIRSEISEGYYKRYNGSDMITLSSPSYNGAKDSIVSKIHDDFVGEQNIERIPISLIATFFEGQEATIIANSSNCSVSVSGDVVESAINSKTSREDIFKSINKLGNTYFINDTSSIEESVFVSDNPFYSLKKINELRRAAIDALMLEIIKSNGFDVCRTDYNNKYNVSDPEPSNLLEVNNTRRINISLINEKQFDTVSEYLQQNSDFSNIINAIYISEELIYDLLHEDKSKLVDFINNSSFDIYVYLTQIRRIKDYKYLDCILSSDLISTFDGFVISNIEDLSKIIDGSLSGKTIVSDFGLYTWNSSSYKALEENIDIFGLPIEISKNGQIELINCSGDNSIFEKMIYGYIPLMRTANCIFKTTGNCKVKSGYCFNETTITDRTGRKMSVVSNCRYCNNTIYNSVPVSLSKTLPEYGSNVLFRIAFTIENEKNTREVLDFYKKLFVNNLSITPNWEYTNGFEKQSTE